MEDEAGGDSKLLAVPIDKILPIYTHWQKPEDMNELRLKPIQHFFEHYKDLEAGKWVKVQGLGRAAAAATRRSRMAGMAPQARRLKPRLRSTSARRVRSSTCAACWGTCGDCALYTAPTT